MALLAEPKRKQKLGIDPNNKNWANDSNAFGQSMMKKMGWKEGSGLGANEDGRVIPVKASLKIDNRGLGCNTRLDADSWIAHQEGFDEILALLNNNSETAAKDSTEAKTEEGSRQFYGRFSRGRVKQLRTTEDLDSILGRRKSSGRSQAQKKEEIKVKEAEDKSSTDENDENEDKEKDGFVTVTSSCSVQDYFAQKMKAKNIALPSMTKTQDENEDVNKVAEESDGFQDKWSGNGYQTSTTSVQGYFAQKMKMKKARMLPLPVNRCDEGDSSQPQDSKIIQNENVSVEEDVSKCENSPVVEDQVDGDDKKNAEKENSKKNKKRKKSSLDDENDDDDSEESNRSKKRKKTKGSKQDLQSDVCAEEMEITEEQSDTRDNSKTKRKSKKKKDCGTEISEQNDIPDESDTSDSTKIAKNKRKSADDGDETKSLIQQNDDCDNCSEGSKSNNNEDATCDTVIKEKKKRRKNRKKKALLKTDVEKNESELDKEVGNTDQDQCEETQTPKVDDENTIEKGESDTVSEEEGDNSTAPETSDGKSSRNAKKKMKTKMKKIIFKKLEDMKNLKWDFGLNKVKETSGTVYNNLMNDKNSVLGKLRGRILDKAILEGKEQCSSQPQKSKKEIKKLKKQIENLKKTYLDQAEAEKKNCLEKLEKAEVNVIKKVKESTKKNISVINKMSENSHSDAAIGWEAKINEVKTLKKKIISNVREKKGEIIQDIEKIMNDATEKIQQIEKQASVQIEEKEEKLSTEDQSSPFPGANGIEGYCYHKNSD